MKILRVITILSLLCSIFGCAKLPTGPAPPVVNSGITFEQHLDSLYTPGHTYFWLKEFSSYDLRGQLGWDWLERSMPDLAYSLAYSLWETTIKGINVGVCGQFASMYVVAARHHGYDSGFLITYRWNPDGSNVSGHARGWIIYNGSIYISDNQYLFRSGFKTKKELFDDFSKTWFTNPNGYGWITNNKLEVIYDMTGYIEEPKTIEALSTEEHSMILKSLTSTED